LNFLGSAHSTSMSNPYAYSRTSTPSVTISNPSIPPVKQGNYTFLVRALVLVGAGVAVGALIYKAYQASLQTCAKGSKCKCADPCPCGSNCTCGPTGEPNCVCGSKCTCSSGCSCAPGQCKCPKPAGAPPHFPSNVTPVVVLTGSAP